MASTRQREARDRRIVEMYTKRGLSTPQISAKVGINPTRIGQILRANKVRIKPNGSFARPLAKNIARNNLIARLYSREGLNTRQIAKQIGGISADGVLKVLQAQGVPRRVGGWIPPTPKATIRIRRYAAKVAPLIGRGPGTTAADFARMGGFKPGTLGVHLRELGVPIRRGLDSKRAVLSFEDVREIKRLLVTTKRSFNSLAQEFGASDSTIWSISAGNSWADVPWPAGKCYTARRKRSKAVRRVSRGSRRG